MAFIPGDLQATQNVAFDKLLETFLQGEVLDIHRAEAPEKLLESCLAIVTPLCNLPIKLSCESEELFTARGERYKDITKNMQD